MSEFHLEDIDIKSFASLPLKEANRLKIEVINRFDLERIPVTCLPEVHQSSYYFISYSHKDYRKVYEDLFALEEEGLSIWYDRGIPAGKNWRDIVNKFMVPFDCKGVIFYLSENALQAPGVLDEILYAVKLNKPFIAINLPFESDYLHHGESVKGKVFKVREMLDILLENGVELPAGNVRKLQKIFPDDVIYLPLFMAAATKVEKVLSALPDEPMFTYDPSHKKVVCLNDPNAFRITEKDFDIRPDPIEKENQILFTLGDCCFSNARNLEYVAFPKKLCFQPSGRYAFHNCLNLKEIKGLVLGFHVPEAMFYNCHQLEKVETNPFAPLLLVYDYAFAGCHNLNLDFLKGFRSVQRIGDYAFAGCNRLKTIGSLPSTRSVGSFAFSECLELETANLSNPEKIGEAPFAGCEKLQFIQIDEKNKFLESIDGVLYTKESHVLHSYPMGRKEIVLDPRCKFIGSFVFSKLSKRASLTIPEGIQDIGFQCMRDSTSLVEVHLPSTLMCIHTAAFLGCTGLQHVYLHMTKERALKYLRRDDTSFHGVNLEYLECVDGKVRIRDIKIDSFCG